MQESVDPRGGLAGPNSPANADPIHGHEWNPSGYTGQTYNDMQYACTFELPVSKTCLDNSDCDCYFQTPAEAASVRNPICQDPASGTFSTTQRRAKAYPGLRELEVLRGLGEQAIVGSICPANSRDTARADYGYRPVISAIVNRLRNPLRGCVIIN